MTEDLPPSATRLPPVEPAAVTPDCVLELYAQVLAQRSLPAAANVLVGTLAQRLGLARVSLALHQDGRTSLIATSDPAPPLARSASGSPSVVTLPLATSPRISRFITICGAAAGAGRIVTAPAGRHGRSP